MTEQQSISDALTAMRNRLTVVPGGKSADPACSVCRDAGFVVRRLAAGAIAELVPCPAEGCPVRVANLQRRADRVLGEANIPPVFEDATMANVRQAPAILQAVEEAIAVGHNLHLYGPAGTGKSYLAAALLRRELERGRTGRFAVVPDLLALIRRGYGRQSPSGASAEEVLDAVESVDLLVLDDLGAEKLVNSQGERSEWVLETLYRLVNSRYLNRRQTITTTNLSGQELYARLGRPIVSRFLERCRQVRFEGADRRLLPPRERGR